MLSRRHRRSHAPARRVLGTLALGLAAALVAGCSGDGPGVTRPTSTDDGDEVGWDQAALDEILVWVDTTRASGFAIFQKGEVVAEGYRTLDLRLLPEDQAAAYQALQVDTNDDGFPIEDVSSLQKSVVAVLVGAAQDRELLDIEDPVSDHLGAGWSNASVDDEAAITIRHLLSMTSGLDEELSRVAAPGEAWFYNTPAYRLLLDVMSAASGLEPETYLQEWLADLTDMQDTEWRIRDSGERGLGTTVKDLINFGRLILGRGEYEGDRVVSASWMNAMLGSSSAGNPSYGYLWWLNGKSDHTLPNGEKTKGWIMPSAPSGAFFALGAHDRLVAVFPQRELVVVRIGTYITGPGREDRIDDLLELITQAAPR